MRLATRCYPSLQARFKLLGERRLYKLGVYPPYPSFNVEEPVPSVEIPKQAPPVDPPMQDLSMKTTVEAPTVQTPVLPVPVAAPSVAAETPRVDDNNEKTKECVARASSEKSNASAKNSVRLLQSN